MQRRVDAPWMGFGVEFLLATAFETEKVGTALRRRLERAATAGALAREAGVPLSLVRRAARLRPGTPPEAHWDALTAWADRELPAFRLPPVCLLLAAAALTVPLPDQPALRTALLRALSEFHRAHGGRLPPAVLEMAEGALDDGRCLTRAQREALLAAAGGALSSREVGHRLGVSLQAVGMRRARGALFAVREGAGPWRYPAFQFTPEGVPEHLAAVLRTFRVTSPWRQLELLLGPAPSGSGTLMDCVRAGCQIEEVRARIRAAEACAVAPPQRKDPIRCPGRHEPR